MTFRGAMLLLFLAAILIAFVAGMRREGLTCKVGDRGLYVGSMLMGGCPGPVRHI